MPDTQNDHYACMLARLIGIAFLCLGEPGPPVANQPNSQLPKELPRVFVQVRESYGLWS